MPQPRPDDLLAYGHLGEVIYDASTEEWHFQRIPGIQQQLLQVSEAEVFVDGTVADTSRSIIQPATARNRNIRDLVKSEPVFAPAAFLLHSLVQISEAVVHATSTYDPISSNLFAFGTALDLRARRSERKDVNIVAVVGGLGGEVVRLFRLQKTRLKLEGHADVNILCTKMNKTEESIWTGDRVPVQQVCFSVNESKSGAWFAVRFSTKTSILQPVLRDRPTLSTRARTERADGQQSPPSTLDANPIVDLVTERTGGATHVDVTFNPWKQHELAVLDTNGRWSIWNIKERPSWSSMWDLLACASGSLTDCIGGDSKMDELATNAPDGWGLILWVYDIDTITVANRRILTLCNINDRLQKSCEPDLGLDSRSHWIIDVKRSPASTADLFVLTTLCIFWLRVEAGEDNAENSVECRILLARRHFRSQEDPSLRLSLCGKLGDTVIIANISSSSTELVTVFTFAESQTLRIPKSISDPFILPLRNDQEKNFLLKDSKDLPCKRQFMSDLYMVPLVCEPSFNADTTMGFKGLADAGVRFYQLFVMYKDLSVHEMLYALVKTGQNVQGTIRLSNAVEGEVETMRKSIRGRFVVPDSFISDEQESALSDAVCEDEATASQRGSLSAVVSEDPWTLNLEWLAEEIDAGEAANTVLTPSTEDYMQEVINDLVYRDSGVYTLCDLFPKLPTANVDDMSRLLQAFLDGVYGGSIVPRNTGSMEAEDDRLRHIPLLTPATYTPIDHSGDDEIDLPLLRMYEKLLNLWITTLASRIPTRTRIALDRQLRQISAELYLSAHALHYGPPISSVLEPASPVTFENKLSLPLRRKGSLPRFSGKHKENDGSSSPFAMVEPESSQPAGAMLPSSKTTPSLQPQRSESPAAEPSYSPYQRLQILTTLQPQASLSEPVQKMISRWELGEDPDNYDWRSMQQRSDPQDSAGDEAQRRRLRHEKRRKRHLDGSHATSSQTNLAVPSNPQPETQLRQQASSQMTVPQVLENQSPKMGSRNRQANSKKFWTPRKGKPGF